MSNILKSYKNIGKSNVNLYLEELIHEDDVWYRVVNDEVEFKDYRHQRLKSIQNYNDFEKKLKESYKQQKDVSTMAPANVAVGGDSGGSDLPRWRKIAVTYNGEFVKYNGVPVTYEYS